MLTILASLFGFISSTIPDIFKIFNDRADKKHELEILKLQISQSEKSQSQKLEEIKISNINAEAPFLYKTYNTGISWVDALNGTVRPVIAYSFFALYAFLKIAYITSVISNALPLSQYFYIIWSQEDTAIFAGIISFYFGQRAMYKIRSK